MKSLYPSPGPSCPWELKGVLDLVEGWLALLDDKYVQPNGNGSPLPGVASSESDFFAEGLDQHDHNYYLELLGAPTVPIVAPGAAANSRAAARAANAG